MPNTTDHERGVLHMTGPMEASKKMEEPGEPLAGPWEVSVNVNGDNILTIGSNHLSGVENIDDFADIVRNCGEHLLAFIGRAAEARTSVEPLLQQVGDSIADVFGQMLKGNWQDDHGHAVFNNIKMAALKTSLEAIAKFRADHLGYPRVSNGDRS